MTWVPLTRAADGNPVWVNLDRFSVMQEGEFERAGETCTRLISGGVEEAINVRERPEQIIQKALI